MNLLIQFFLIAVSMKFVIERTSSFVIYDCLWTFEQNLGNYDVKCTNDEGYSIDINCHHNSLIDLPEIEIKLNFVLRITFVNCTFLRDVNIQHSLNSMGLITHKVFFELDNIPNRLNFKNFSAPELSLRGSHIKHLPYDLLYGVVSLRSLNVTHTSLEHIPQDFFSDWAENLLELQFRNGKLRKITRKDFARVVSLSSLDLGFNEIDEIESGSFDKLVDLLFLSLLGNPFRTLPPGIFHQLHNLNQIDLSYRRSNSNVPVVTTRDVIQKKHLPLDLFKGASNLTWITMTGLLLPEPSTGFFDNNKALIFLVLRRVGIEFLPLDIFKELTSLRHLVIRDNRLTTIIPETFIELHSLQAFSAVFGNLTQIDIRPLLHLDSMQSINLSYNQIINVMHQGDLNIFIDQQFTRQIDMNFSFNSFSEFNVTFVNLLKYSQTLDLRNNQINKVNLTGFASGMNKFDKNMVNNTSGLVKVYLANNPLHCDYHIIDFIRYLNGTSHQDLQKYLMIFAKEGDKFGEGFTCSSPPELKARDVRSIHSEEFYRLLQTNTVGDACNKICLCQEYPSKQVMYIDCSYRNLKQLPIKISNVHHSSIELNMSGNVLQQLIPSPDHSYWINVTKLDVSSNNISEILLSTSLSALQDLKLHNNSISRLNSNTIQYFANAYNLRSLTLHNNKWICDCEIHVMLQSSIRKKISNHNLHEILCYGSKRKLYEMTFSELCEDTQILIMSASFTIALFGIIVGSMAFFYYRYENQIKMWLYSRQLCLRFITDDELDIDKEYDAFISFSHRDEDFVDKEIVSKLEEGPRPYKLCLHYRDWLAGEWIPLQISRSVANSRRTIIILTPNFLESVWGLVEFRTAHTQAIKDGQARLIVILYGEIGNTVNLDQDLKDYLSLNTYIKWGDPWFWQKLKYALPHRSHSSRKVANYNTVQYRVSTEETIIGGDDAEVISIH